MEKINLNTDQPEALMTLPGVGPALAERIIAARPFETIEDLREVNGVGPALFERLAPLLNLEPAQTQENEIQPEVGTVLPPAESETPLAEEAPTEQDETPITESPVEEEQLESGEGEEGESESEAESETLSTEKAIIPVEEPEAEQSTSAKGARTVTWGRVMLLTTAFSLGAFVFAVLLTLGIIGTVNNGLRYASPGDLRALNREFDNLDSQIGIILSDLESLRSRLDNLESMSTQINQLEATAEQLSSDVAATVDIVTEMETQIDELESSTAGFRAFLDGLSELLAFLEEPAQEEAPQEAP